MKIYLLKRSGRNWIGNFPLSLQLMDSKKAIGYADYHFYKRKDAQRYAKQFDGEYGNPFGVWSADVKPDKRDNRKRR